MKAFLLYKDGDFDLKGPLPTNEKDLVQDLELDTLFEAMAFDDKFLLQVARKAMLSSLRDVRTILFRQAILKDCLDCSSLVRRMYEISVESIEREKKIWRSWRDSPESILHRSVQAMEMFVGEMKKLKSIADEHAEEFKSEGFVAFFAMIKKELSDEYFASIDHHLSQLQFRHGVLISAELEKGNKGAKHVLRKPNEKQGWLKRLLAKKPPVYSFAIADRDETGAKALSELRDRGLNLAANALAQSSDHVLSFFEMLRTELAFYVGCLNLHARLTQMHEEVCYPVPAPLTDIRHSFVGLYDLCLALTMGKEVVGNEMRAEGKSLAIITGANQGGKSTFLRSIGLAQLMMQCGMFVAARSFEANVCAGIFTHYKREEDASMNSGKLDEELDRMSSIVDSLKPNAMMLFNESFAATNEREGSEIARQIVAALLEKRIKVFFVTHMYEFAHHFYQDGSENAIFLRAERHHNGVRTFKIVQGEPLETSFGEDLFRRVFGSDGAMHELQAVTAQGNGDSIPEVGEEASSASEDLKDGKYARQEIRGASGG